jgi:antitoxin component of MazEF toxin-antitoxin module
MRLKIIKVGDQLALPLPEQDVKTLGLSEGSEVEVTVEEDNKWILITADGKNVDLDEIDADYAKMLIEFIEENRGALEELAGLRSKND